MGADNNIFIRITGETNMDAVTKKLEASRSKVEELAEDMQRLTKDEIEAARYVRAHADAYADLDKELEEQAKEYKKLRAEMEKETQELERSIEALEMNAKAANLLNGSSKSVTSQIRQMRETMMEMEEAGLETSEAYEELAVKSSRLTDAQGDLQQRIRILASDTMQLDGAMSMGSGLAGAFNTATSATELLGGETEGLQKAFYKVQATLSILNGVQEVANALNKDSAFRVVLAANAKKLFTKETKIETKWQAVANSLTEQSTRSTGLQAVAYKGMAIATGGATKALKILRIAMVSLGLPAILIAVAGLIAYFDQINDQLGISNETWDKFKQAAMGALEVVKGTLANIGEGLVKIIKGDFSGAWEAFKKTADVSSKYAAGVAKEAASQAAKVTDDLYKLSQARNSAAQERYAKALADGLRTINKAQQEAKAAMTSRHASDVEMAKEELEYAMRRAAITQEQNEKAIAANLKEEASAKQLMNAKWKAVQAEKKGTQQYLDALNEYNDAQSNYLNIAQKTTDLRQAIDDANQEVLDASVSFRQAVEQQQTQLVNAKINIMKNGADKEIAQINANYEEQLRSIQGNGDTEVALRKAIEENQQKEVQAVRDKYAKQEEQAMLNHQLAMSQIEASVSMDPASKIAALEAQFNAQKALYTSQEDWLKAELSNGTITQQDYNDGILEITRNRIQAEIDLEQNKMQVISDSFQNALGYMQKVSDLAFEAMSIGVQEELDNLDKYYTTDAEEAAKDANKKYISEKEYEKKKAALQEKQAKYAKAQALTNIAIQTATAIMTTLAQLGATPWGIALSAVAGAMGAAQLAVASAKPLAQYAKGRKGGKGEYAVVGERGAEIMWVPEGASIIPNNKISKPETWGDYGVPILPVPELPTMTGSELENALMWRTDAKDFDYERLGRVVAANIPQQKAVTVNVDRSGITVQNGRDTQRYLNTKYQGAWR